MVDLTTLKQGGFIMQRTGDAFTVRITAPGGRVTAEHLQAMQEAARQFGRGYVHLTTRQGFELPWVQMEDFDALREHLARAGLFPAGCGPRIRNVMACPGNETCSRGLVDTYSAAKALSDSYAGRWVNIKKLKLAVAGCPNSCTAPQHNDLGFMATVEPVFEADLCNGCGICIDACREGAIGQTDDKVIVDRSLCVNCGQCIAACPSDAWVAGRQGYTVYLGGKVGRHPRLGIKVAEFVQSEDFPKWVDGLLEFLEKNGNRGERLGAFLDRVGTDGLQQYLPAEARLGKETVSQ